MEDTIQGCIFDLDGVIVDTAKYHYASWVKIAEKFDFTFSEKDNERLKGINRRASLDILLEIGKIQQSEAEKTRLCEEKNKIYLDYISDLSPNEALEGLKDFILELKSNQVKIALGSASKNARFVLNRLEMIDYFDAIVDGNDVKRSKPDPEVFLKGANLIDCEPKKTIVFEDAEKGLLAAIAGGFRTVGVGKDESLNIAEININDFSGYSISKLLEAIKNIDTVK